MSVGIVNVIASVGDIDALRVDQLVASGISTQTLIVSGTLIGSTISGSVGQFGGALSAQSGSFSSSLMVSGVPIATGDDFNAHIDDSQVHSKLSNVVVTRSGGRITRLDWANGDFEVIRRNNAGFITTVSGNVWKKTMVRDSDDFITNINFSLSNP